MNTPNLTVILCPNGKYLANNLITDEGPPKYCKNPEQAFVYLGGTGAREGIRELLLHYASATSGVSLDAAKIADKAGKQDMNTRRTWAVKLPDGRYLASDPTVAWQPIQYTNSLGSARLFLRRDAENAIGRLKEVYADGIKMVRDDAPEDVARAPLEAAQYRFRNRLLGSPKILYDALPVTPDQPRTILTESPTGALQLHYPDGRVNPPGAYDNDADLIPYHPLEDARPGEAVAVWDNHKVAEDAHVRLLVKVAEDGKGVVVRRSMSVSPNGGHVITYDNGMTLSAYHAMLKSKADALSRT